MSTMEIKDIISELPFDSSKIKDKETFFKELEKHYAILGVKAEVTGDDELTEAIDTIRSIVPNLENMTDEQKSQWDSAFKIIKRYEAQFSKSEEKDMLLGDIQCELDTLQEMWDEFRTNYRKTRDLARKLEKEYRDKYGVPSGLWNEEAYNNERCFFDEDEDDDD